jgi:hypothetical protein
MGKWISPHETAGFEKKHSTPSDTQILNTAKLLSEEFSQIWETPRFSTEDDYRTAVHARGKQAALCLSGGGIRSAAFALGVMQAFAQKGLLTQFQYLSTVSGGGYTGGWLWRWISELDSVDDEAKGADKVADKLSQPIEPPQVQALREGSTFLTPKPGIASRDTWTVIVIFVRNILLNWLVFGPALFLVALMPNFYVAIMDIWRERANLTVSIIVLVASAAFLTLTVRGAWLYLPSHRSDNSDQKHGKADTSSDRFVKKHVVVPGLVWAFLMPIALAPEVTVVGICAIFVVTFSAKFLGYCLASRCLEGKHKECLRENLGVWIWCSLTSSAALAVGVLLVEWLSQAWEVPKGSGPSSLAVLAILGPLLVTLTQLVLSAQFVALRRLSPKKDDVAGPTPDLDREWLARLSAAKIVPTLGWALLALACLLLPHLFFVHPQWLGQLGQPAAIIMAVISGVFSVLGGASAKSPLSYVQSRFGYYRKLLVNVILAISTVIFVAALLMSLSRFEFLTAQWRSSSLTVVFAHIVLGIFAAILVCAASKKIDVNRFSLNGLYRNRLARAFLGAGRTSRQRDAFTGFDPCDDIRMCNLLKAATNQPETPTPTAKPSVPEPQAAAQPSAPSAGTQKRRVLFPVINVTLNLLRSDRLAWQERKAEPFVITPIACGSAMLRFPGTRKAGTVPDGAYCPSGCYGGDEHDSALPGTGISLAAAMTISGAAASPSMGYHSSPTTSFLMTLFNVRLGAWLANPSCATEEQLRRSGPSFALRPLLYEMLGLTDDNGTEIYLSDGGHFDNLGLYEMVRRRCRYIVVSDAGCDPNCHFEDLGNAVRKVFIDQNIQIDIMLKNIFPRTKLGENPAAFALGTIIYPEQPDTQGLLLYIKPSYFPPVPADLQAYAEANDLFPHQSTLDQWFSESQFESYRKLGAFLVGGLLGREKYDSMADFFEDLQKRLSGTNLASNGSRLAGSSATDGGAGVPCTVASRSLAPAPHPSLLDGANLEP